MGRSAANFRNILVIDLGQLGDVVQSLPALGALRRRFPDSKITAMVEKTPAEVVRLCGVVDEIVEIDRPQLKDRPKHRSIFQLFRLVARTRRSKFDLVVDLHSLYETNILGFLSGTRHRLFANRESRSLDFLSNFRPKPPIEDKSAHISDRYLDVLAPLEVDTRRYSVGLKPAAPDVEYAQMLWAEHKLNGKKGVIGLFPGAGHPSRCWD
ncbi:MAG: glycosyltransferase family 9 protein, partial [Pyrinomonadaceae bacterium]